MATTPRRDAKVTAAKLRAYIRRHPRKTGAEAALHFGVKRQRIWRVAKDAGLRLAGSRLARVEGL